MGQAPFQSKVHACQRDEKAVAALVRILAESGFEPHRIEAALRNTTTPGHLDRLADVYAAACSGAPPRRARAA